MQLGVRQGRRAAWLTDPCQRWRARWLLPARRAASGWIRGGVPNGLRRLCGASLSLVCLAVRAMERGRGCVCERWCVCVGARLVEVCAIQVLCMRVRARGRRLLRCLWGAQQNFGDASACRAHSLSSSAARAHTQRTHTTPTRFAGLDGLQLCLACTRSVAALQRNTRARAIARHVVCCGLVLPHAFL